MKRIDAGLLIPGRGEPVRDGTVLIDGARICYAGPAAGAPSAPDVVARSVAAVLPGLWDCHGHFMGSRRWTLSRLATEPVPPYAAAKLVAIADIHADAAAGHPAWRHRRDGHRYRTDRDGPANSWGTNGSELVHLVTLGMTPLQAIEAATATAPRTLGPRAPKSGPPAAGYDANLITVDGDPLADISILASPDRITGVWVGGRQAKGAPPH